MSASSHVVSIAKYLLLFGTACSTLAQQPTDNHAQAEISAAGPVTRVRTVLKHPPLFLKEEWNQGQSGPQPLTQDVVADPNFELKFYGAAKDMLVNGVAGDENDPRHIFMGTCGAPCGATLWEKKNYVDLTGLAKIRWVTRVSGFHKLHPMLKLADGTLLVGNHGDGEVSDNHETEFSISDVRWIRLDSDKLVTKGDILDKPDLSRVDEVGFVDLIPGSGHGDGGYSVLALFEVYGKAVPRDAAQGREKLDN